MLSTSSRLLHLLSLLQARRHWPSSELAERLGVDARTVRRDVDRLRALGYPVSASSGLGGGYQLGVGATMPPVALGDDEAVAMVVALRAATSSLEGMDETVLALLAKLDRLLPVHLRTRVGALESVMLALPDGGPRTDADVLTRVAAACRDRQRLHFVYRDHEGHESERAVEPLHLVHARRRYYLVAWDRGREDFRTFRLDRVKDPSPDGGTFPPRALPVDATTFVSRALALAPYRYAIRARLVGSITELAGTVSTWSGVLEPLDDQSCVLHAGAETLEALAAHLLLAGRELTLLDEPTFLPELRAVIERLRAGLG